MYYVAFCSLLYLYKDAKINYNTSLTVYYTILQHIV